MRLSSVLKILFSGFIVLFFLGLLLIFLSNYLIIQSASDKTFSDIRDVPNREVGLVLGTSKYYKGGGLNSYFKYRIDAAEKLYKAGKIKFILVSGDNGSISYNEPITIKKELMKRGIPEAVIFLDYAGFRTLDSVVRAKVVFELEEVILISQKFHNERAIYIAQKHGLDAIGFNAENVEGTKGFRIQMREYFARTKAFLDILFGVEPKFYGDKEKVGDFSLNV